MPINADGRETFVQTTGCVLPFCKCSNNFAPEMQKEVSAKLSFLTYFCRNETKGNLYKLQNDKLCSKVVL